MKTTIIVISILSGVLLFILGNVTKKCEPCLEPTPVIKYIEIQHKDKEHEIKREAQKKISDIPNATISDLDSIWSEYSTRYVKDTFVNL